LISRGPRARGAVLKGMIPAYERKVTDLLNTVKIGSMDSLDKEDKDKLNPSALDLDKDKKDEGCATAPPDIRPGQGASAPSAATSGVTSPDAMNSVQGRVAAMPPIVLGKDIAEDLGATLNSVVLVTSPQGELTPFGLVPKYIRFRVVGIFNSGF